MPQERLPKQALLAKALGRRPVGRPRTKWTNYIKNLGWNSSGLHPRKMMDMMEDRKVWRLNLELLPLQRSRKSGNEERKRRKFDLVFKCIASLRTYSLFILIKFTLVRRYFAAMRAFCFDSKKSTACCTTWLYSNSAF